MKPKFAETNDSFSTGAIRGSQAGKPRPGLSSPFAALRKGIVNAHGAENYGPRNYEKGMEFSRVIESIFRHLYAYMIGDITEDHLSQAGWNIDALLHFEELIKLDLLSPELNDLPMYKKRVRESFVEYLNSLPKPIKKPGLLETIGLAEEAVKRFDDEVVGVDLDKCGTTDGITPITLDDIADAGRLFQLSGQLPKFETAEEVPPTQDELDISHHRTPGIDENGQGVYGIPSAPDVIEQFDKATKPENPYDGDWNSPDQSPGFWRIKGNDIVFFDIGEDLETAPGFTIAHVGIKYAKKRIDSGEWVPNTWSEDL